MDGERNGQSNGKAESEGRYDEDGLPLHRKPTMDDVRGGDHFGRRLAVGCTAFVLLLVLAFWVWRMGLFG